jgi:uncharacterized damage-inducible protein DinB
MSQNAESSLLDALLDSWDRNNTILVNLLRALPPGTLSARAAASSPSIAQLFSHIHYVRLAFLQEDAPEQTHPAVPDQEWLAEAEPAQIASHLDASARAVRQAVRDKIERGQAMDLHYDHPVLFLQHMIWHEGYHHGQIKLTLKLTGHPLEDAVIGPLTWDVWIDKTQPPR